MFLDEKNRFVGEPGLRPLVVGSDAHFMAWLRTRDPSEEYNILSTKDCLVCQYVAHALERPVGFVQALAAVPAAEGGVINFAAHGDGFLHQSARTSTFGDALSRAHSFLQANAQRSGSNV